MEASDIISIFALSVAATSMIFSVLSWRESNRPIVIARIQTNASGNLCTLLDLLIENVGNRPAKNISLSIKEEDIEDVFARGVETEFKNCYLRCFSPGTVIPILAHGKYVSNAFGRLANDEKEDWKAGRTLEISILYSDLKDRQFREKMNIKLDHSGSFAGLEYDDT